MLIPHTTTPPPVGDEDPHTPPIPPGAPLTRVARTTLRRKHHPISLPKITKYHLLACHSETTLSPYVNKNSCCISISPALVSEDYNEGDIMKYNHPQTTEQVGEDSQNALDIDVNIKNDNETKLEDEDKFLILPRNFYQEGNCPTSVPVFRTLLIFQLRKTFHPYQGGFRATSPCFPFLLTVKKRVLARGRVHPLSPRIMLITMMRS
ncbi:hypothetical protein CEXT_492721 [Caerostris extrusa]|uniref:Uncharacterized protein n=1 Tax=Caerostris extrusa TaxID=172846 RepID=A0AAV4MJ56_CAEEX|nr:hypothetical protein CEXT_492721 [Caerostris extrusa]